MVDAEQSYFQPAIRRIVLQAMKRYNRDMAIIFNTYQCYLTVSLSCKHLSKGNEYTGMQKIIFSIINAPPTKHVVALYLMYKIGVIMSLLFACVIVNSESDQFVTNIQFV